MGSRDLLIKRAKWRGGLVDVLVEQGRIAALEPEGALNAVGVELVDAAGMTLMPGLVDCHVHFREPGQTHKEDIAGGLAAAAHGGFCRAMCMANTSPVNDTPEIAASMLARAAEAHPAGPRLHPVGALTVGLAGREIAPLEALREAGCAAVSNDGEPVADTALFREALLRADRAGLKVIDHCEDPYLAKGEGVNLGEVSRRLGLKGQPAVAEALQVARDALLAAETGVHVHLAHISCRESIEIIARAKDLAVPLTAETCPHYLSLTEEEVEKHGALAKVNPPLRVHDDVVAVRQALRTGVIDCIATDHAPHAKEEKERPFSEAPCGISGLDSALAVCLDLRRQGELSEEDLMRALAFAPSSIFGFPSCGFEVGDPADFLLLDEDEVWELNAATMRSRGLNTPLLGRELKGRVKALFIAGIRIV
jgi:dihydroorotase